jgi:hypothetical protein
VKVRFSVTRPPEELRIVLIDWTKGNEPRLEIRFREPQDIDTHDILYTDDLTQPSALWKSMQMHSVLEGDHVRRGEVLLPHSLEKNWFFQLKRP